MTERPPPTFAGSPLDRASERRVDETWLEARLSDPLTRFLPFWRGDPLVRGREAPGLAWARGEIRASMDPGVGPVFLGLHEGVAHFALDLTPLDAPLRELGLEGRADFEDTRAVAGRLPAAEAAIVAQGRSLVDWHATHRFCARCGASTQPAQGGAMRVCVRCKAEHFPRVNPVVIMLVLREQRCLLGRQPVFPPGMYSALAGFVEPGETLEEAVRREVREEAGIRVGAVRYVASQPWPFPSSLMLGCAGEAQSEEVRVDRSELDDARWFARDALRRALEGEDAGVRIPPPMAIAHHLIRAWVSGELD